MKQRWITWCKLHKEEMSDDELLEKGCNSVIASRGCHLIVNRLGRCKYYSKRLRREGKNANDREQLQIALEDDQI